MGNIEIIARCNISIETAEHVALEAHNTKCYHLGMGRTPIAKTTFASAKQNRDYHIFEDFAFFMMEHARKK